jgi:hypothetical protein
VRLRGVEATRHEIKTLRDRYWNSGVLVALMTHILISSTVAKALACAKSADGAFMLIDNPDLRCFSPSWYLFNFPVSMVLLVVW